MIQYKNIFWDLVEGKVKVYAAGSNNEYEKVDFDFECSVSGEVNAYNKLEGITDMACAQGHLLDLYHVEIKAIEY